MQRNHLLYKREYCTFAQQNLRAATHNLLVMTRRQIHHNLFFLLLNSKSTSNRRSFLFFQLVTGITRAEKNVNSLDTMHHRYQNVNYLTIIFPYNIQEHR